jgi:hypothetical protein
MGCGWRCSCPCHQLRVISSRQLHDLVGDLGKAIEREQIVAVDLLAVEVLHDPLAEDTLGVGVLPEPDDANLCTHMRHQRDRRVAQNRCL